MKSILIVSLGLLTLAGLAQAPAGFDNGTEGKSAEDLKGILSDHISGNTSGSYLYSLVTTATKNTAYAYAATTSAEAGSLTITAGQIPSGLILTDNGNGRASHSATPSYGDVGNALVTTVVSDGSNSDIKSITITVSAYGVGSDGGGNASVLHSSGYKAGSSRNEALEIVNFFGSSVDLFAYQIQKQTNGAGSCSAGPALSGTLSGADDLIAASSGFGKQFRV